MGWKIAVLILAAELLASGRGVGQNLIMNGNFSTNAVNNCGGNIASWISSSDMQLSDCCDQNLPGNWWVDLTGCGYGNGRWTQQSVATTIGSSYLLEWDLGCYANVTEMTDAGANLEINGQFIGHYSHADFSGSELAYHRFKHCFVATQTITTVKFTANGSPTSLTPASMSATAQYSGVTYPYTGRIALDNVSLMLVTPEFQNFAASGATICQGGSVTLTVTGVTSYTWLPSNITNTSYLVSPAVSSCYTVRATDNQSCTASKTVCVAVTECIGFSEPAPVPEISVWPNPANNCVFLYSAAGSATTFRIIDITGKQLIAGNFNTSLRIDISDFKKGVYFISVSSENLVFYRKLIVE